MTFVFLVGMALGGMAVTIMHNVEPFRDITEEDLDNLP